jgi:SAM-dependent methyltransferase
MTADAGETIGEIVRQGWRGGQPARYRRTLDAGPKGFRRRVADALFDGCAVLDLGAGARPVVPVRRRPENCTYVGLDVSRDELVRAPAGSYDEIAVTDAAVLEPTLRGRFDLVVSMFALEHVENLEASLANARAYLRSGGRLIAYFSGRYSVPSTLNRILPERVSEGLLGRLTGRDPDSVYSARCDRCSDRDLRELVSRGWAHAEIVPCFWGEKYFRFSRPLHAAYLVYEELAWRGGRRQLATHYLVDAVAD